MNGLIPMMLAMWLRRGGDGYWGRPLGSRVDEFGLGKVIWPSAVRRSFWNGQAIAQKDADSSSQASA